MPNSATERFARTYTPRLPDDSYDALGGGLIADTIIKAPFEKPFELVSFKAGFSGLVLSMTLVPAGQVARINLSCTYTSGALQTQAITAQIQSDKFQLTAAMAGGTLH